MEFLIIGGGPAGLGAATVLCHLCPESSITLLSNEPDKPYAKMALPYLLAGVVEEKDILLTVPDQLKIELGQEVIRIDPVAHLVECATGKKWSYDRLLLAPGGVPDRPDIVGNALPFVFTIRNLSDIRGIKPLLRGKTRHAVIAGAGPVSMEIGDALHRQGLQITFLVTSNRLFSTMLDQPSAAFLEQQLSDKGITIRKGEDIIKIEKNGQVHLKSGGTLACDLVVFGKGVKPCTRFLAESGIKVKNGIGVDACQQTNLPDIYAAGDAAETLDLASGEPRVNALWPEAVEQGKVAALTMAGRPSTYQGSLARNILRVFGVSILVAGQGRADGPEVRIDTGPGYYHKLVLDGGVLKGLIFIGEVRNEGLYRELIKRRIDIAPFTQAMLKGSFSYPRFQRHTLHL